MPRQLPVVDGLPVPGGAYSHMASRENLAFTVGSGPQASGVSPAPDGIETQTGTALANVERELRAAGLGLTHGLKTTMHLAASEGDFAKPNEVYRRIVPQLCPVRTAVGSQLLEILVESDEDATGERQ